MLTLNMKELTKSFLAAPAADEEYVKFTELSKMAGFKREELDQFERVMSAQNLDQIKDVSITQLLRMLETASLYAPAFAQVNTAYSKSCCDLATEAHGVLAKRRIL